MDKDRTDKEIRRISKLFTQALKMQTIKERNKLDEMRQQRRLNRGDGIWAATKYLIKKEPCIVKIKEMLIY